MRRFVWRDGVFGSGFYRVALVMASCIGIVVYEDTTLRLHGYGSASFVVRSPAWIHLMSSRLFSFLNGLGHFLASV